MGPPPAQKTPDGRYNQRACPVLYLSDSEQGVIREVGRNWDGPITIQEYELDSSELRIADFASDDLHNFLSCVFDVAERCCVPGRHGPDSYLFSQLVAQLVEAVGYVGMRVFGVLGDLTLQYRNIVVLEPNEWRRWSLREAGFRSGRDS